MRSAMVRSATSSLGGSTAFPAAAAAPDATESSLVDDIDSPVAFEGTLTTTSPQNNGELVPSTTADPNTLYVNDVSSSSKLFPPAFLVTAARIHPLEDNANAKKFVCYEVSLVGQGKVSAAGAPFVVWRRYTDFLTLYEALRKDHATLVQSVAFPRKCFTGNFSLEVVRDRVVLFERFLATILAQDELKTSQHFLRFLQDRELEQACRLLDERRQEVALPLLENCFGLLDALFTDRCHPVLLMLCRLVAASAHPIPAPEAHKWAEMALRRFDSVCDADLLQLYVPLIKACVYLYWKTGRDKSHLDGQLEGMRKRGINVKTGPTLLQAIHALDPRTESA